MDCQLTWTRYRKLIRPKNEEELKIKVTGGVEGKQEVASFFLLTSMEIFVSRMDG